ncbi:hypothetical protein VN12_10270 [Pirellula sp. SH-Sr6A]|uniref:transcription antitermination factor NusB n=1 Tax=Pirellula sp. SH-Sr6A TaxID=1632865 RepID=UPI00078C544D|nr:transcription antitermination factor NusB [Pirellula sp. SH-Sr6A]AMV32500.1 hypothetical protein VN12_10270 [Pirellula sp. SH-Sr6A]
MTTRRRAREVALQVLYEEDINPLREFSVADQFVQKRMLQNKPLVTFALELLYGVRNHRTDIDQVLSKHAANWSLKRMTTIDRNILRISAYEILFGDVPGRVSINEAIELAKRYGSRNSGQFVNGILDRILKEHQKPAEPTAEPPAESEEASPQLAN